MAVMTRQALFEAAWERPLTEIAEDLGITSTGLKKICDRHDIPTPGRGYWAQVRAGKIFPRPKLRPSKSPHLDEVRIAGAGPLPPVVKAAVAIVRAEASRRSDAQCAPASAAPPVVPPGALATQHDRSEAKPEATAGEAQERRELAATRKALARARPDELGYVSVSGKGIVAARLGAGTHEAALRFLTSLLDAADVHGWRLEVTESGAPLRVAGEALTLRLEDRPQNVPHTPTPREAKAQADRERWGGGGLAYRKWDPVPSGRLALIVEENHWPPMRRTWSARRGRMLEASMPAILEGLAAHAAMKAESRRKHAEEARLRALAEARRVRLEAFDRRENRRAEFIAAIGAALAEKGKLRAVLDHLQAVPDAARKPLASMEAWLARRVKALEGQLDPVAIEISTRHSEVDFAEPPTTEACRWSAPNPELHLWILDYEKGEARSVAELEWAIAEGLISDPGAAAEAGDQPGSEKPC